MNTNFHKTELLLLHIEKSWLFESGTVNLNNKYIVNVSEKMINGDMQYYVEISKSKNYVPLNEDLNIIAFCGENGTGKTTLVNILNRHPFSFSHKYFILYKEGGRFYSNASNVRVKYSGKEYNVIPKISSGSSANSYISNAKTEDFTYSITKYYHLNPTYFDDDIQSSKPLFNRFCITRFELNDGDTVEFAKKSLFSDLSDEDIYTLQNILNSSNILFITVNLLQDNLFEDIIKTKPFKLGDVQNILECTQYKELDEQLSTYITADIKFNDFDTHSVENSFDIELYTKIIGGFNQTCENVFLFILDILKTSVKSLSIINNHKNNIIDNIRFIFISNPFYFSENSPIRRIRNLSSGERQLLQIKHHIALRVFQTGSVWLTEDEIDVHMHPEWQRRFVYLYIKSLKSMMHYSKRAKPLNDVFLTIVFTTHSPFILSDIPNNNSFLLQKNPVNGKTQIQPMVYKTFAGNIGEMFHENFFMKQTVGEHARSILNKVLDEINNPVEYSLIKYYEFKNIISYVADDLLRTLMLEKLEAWKIITGNNDNEKN